MKKITFQMTDGLHSELKDAAAELDTSMASVCREAVTEHLEVLNSDLNDPAPTPNPDDMLGTQTTAEPYLEMIEEAERPLTREPWYVRYSDKVNNFHKGPAPKTTTKKHTCTSNHSDYEEMWDR